MYNVLWLDDEYQKFETFEALAGYQGIQLYPYDIRQSGLDELRLHPQMYDAILLDAKMPEHSSNEVASIKGVKEVINTAHELHIPVYISTGQPDLQKDTTFRDSFENVFVKGDATDDFGGDSELFAKMLSDLAQSEKAVILRRYADIVIALQKMGIEKEGTDIIVPILIAMHTPETHKDFEAKKHYNPLRILIEHIFRVFNTRGILPDAFIVDGKVNITDSLRYLKGSTPKPEHPQWFRTGEVIPKTLGDLLGNMIYKGHTQSHSNIESNGVCNRDYQIFSFTLLLCDTILWANEYIQAHPNYEENKATWKEYIEN